MSMADMTWKGSVSPSATIRQLEGTKDHLKQMMTEKDLDRFWDLAQNLLGLPNPNPNLWRCRMDILLPIMPTEATVLQLEDARRHF